MIDQLCIYFVQMCHVLPCELMSLISLFLCAIAMLGLWHYYGVTGLIVYQALTIVLANIQVLQLAPFATGPMALGNALFATTFWSTYVLSQQASAQDARMGFHLGFIGQIMVTIFMIISLGHNSHVISSDTALVHMADSHYKALQVIFTPSLRIVVASLVAYWLSQRVTILLGINSQKKSHWYDFLALGAANVVDQFLFSYLAWMMFSPEPVSWASLFQAYIGPSLVFRLIANIGAIPVLRACRAQSIVPQSAGRPAEAGSC